ncbi:metallophosphoesterase [bacterium]|nr:metallophosphoesterase [bacterium]
MSVEERIRLFLVLFGVLTIIGVEIAVLWAWIGKRQESQFANPWLRWIFTFLFSLLILSLLYAYFVEPYWIDVSRIRIETPKLKTGSKIVIVQLSDIHSKGWNKNERRLPSIVNALNPDIICLTGDYINKIEALDAVRKMVGELKVKYGIYAVRGNWDAGVASNVDIFKGLKVKMLMGEGERISISGNNIYIAGLDVNDDSALLQALAMRARGDFTILLFHYPDLIEDLNAYDIDLYLAGHTHGGQVAIPFYGAVLTFSKYGKKYERGLYRVGETLLYVNRGIGTEGLPLRFCSRPEITLFEIIGKGK